MENGGRRASTISAYDRKFELFDFVTPPLATTLRVFADWVTGRRGLAYNLLILCLIVVLDPYDLLATHGMFMTVALTLQFIVVLALTYAALTYGWITVMPGRKVVRVFRPALSLAASTAATITTFLSSALYLGEAFDLRAAIAEVPYIFLLSQILEAIFFAFVAPRRLSAPEDARPDAPPVETVPPPPPPPPEAPPATLTIAGKQLLLSEVMHVSSHGHYLRCLVGTEEIWLRGRMLDVLAQTSEVDGVQPRRSWWVAARAVRELRRGGSGDVLVLTDGIEIAIPRARRDEVRAWMDARPTD